MCALLNLYIIVLNCVDLGSECTSCESDLDLHCPHILHLSAYIFTYSQLFTCINVHENFSGKKMLKFHK